MKMKFIVFIALMFLGFTRAFAEEIFVVNPYIVVGDNNKLSLNFQTNADVKLSIDINVKNKNSFIGESESFNQIFKASDFQKLDLGKLDCDKELTYKIKGSNPSVEINNSFASYPCDKGQDLFFGFISDTQIKDAAGQKRADKISATVAELKQLYPFSLIVNAGDVVQHGGQIADWTNYFTTAKPYLQNTYMFAAVGNHDYYDSPMYEKAPPQFRQYLRDNNSGELGNAVVDLGRVTIIMLNSNFDFMNEATFKDQWDWFISQLEANQKINKPVIVTMHHSPFSSSAEWVREIPTRLRNELVPTLEKYSCVKMMMSGHLHMYERSQKGNLPYLVAGPSGGIVNYITYKNPYQVMIKPFVTTFSIFKINKKQIEVTTFTGLKEMIDHFSVNL